MNSSNVSWSLETRVSHDDPGAYHGRISFHFDVVAHMQVSPEKKIKVCTIELEDLTLPELRLEALITNPSLEEIGQIQSVALSEFGRFFTGLLGTESVVEFERASFYLHQESPEDEMYLYCEVNLSRFKSVETCLPCSREIMESLYREGLRVIQGAVEEFLDRRTENL